jgi:hypothetical protein
MADEGAFRYPEALRYATSRIDGWSTETVRLIPEAMSDATPGSTVTFVLPSNHLVQLSSVTVFGDIQGFHGGAAQDQCVFPRGSWSFIRTLQIRVNGTTVQQIDRYNHLHNLFNDMTDGAKYHALAPLHHSKPYDPIGGEVDETVGGFQKNALPVIGLSASRTLGGTQGLAPAELGTRANADYYERRVSGTVRPFTQNAYTMAFGGPFLGFMSAGKWLDTSICGKIELVITFESDSILQRMDSGTDTTSTGKPTYRVQNLRAFCNIGSVSDSVLYNAMAARLAQGAPVSIPYKNYSVFGNRLLTGSAEIPFAIQTQSLDAVYAFCIDPTPADNDPAQTHTNLHVVNPLGADMSEYSTFSGGTNEGFPQPNPVNNRLAKYINQSQLFPTDWAPAMSFRRYSSGVGVNYEAGRITGTRLRINNVGYPSWIPTIPEQYYLAMSCFGGFDKPMAVTPAMNYDRWMNDMSAFCYRLAFQQGLDFTSGIDTRSMNAACAIEYTVSAANPGAPTSTFRILPLIFAEYTSTLEISGYRQINYVP